MPNYFTALFVVICKRRFSVVFFCKNVNILQLPALRQVHTRTNILMEGITSQWAKIKALIMVDLEKFPEKNQRFTAIYSRDREYL